MRVLMLSWEYPPVVEGGLGRHAGMLAERLARDGAAVQVLTRGSGRAASTKERHGVVVHGVPEPAFPRDDIAAFIAWVKRMNEDMAAAGRGLDAPFDLVHSHDWLVAAAARELAHEPGVPWVVTVHATEYGRHQGWVAAHPQSHIHALERRMVHDADRLICCSDFMRRELAAAFAVDPGAVAVIPNGIDPGTMHPVGDLPRARGRFAAPDERLVLLVGRLVYEKGFHLALDALAALIARGGRIRFVLAGSGMAEAELKAQAGRLGLMEHGTFIGWTGDALLDDLYRIADLCVIPSLYEPFGLVALEAAAAGCPCLVADTGGLRELVPAGLRFRAGDATALERAVEALLDDDALRDRLAAQARERALGFDWDEVARATAAVYAALPAARV